MWCWDTGMSKWMLRCSLLLSKLTTVQAVLLLPWRRKPTDQILRKTIIKKQKFSIAHPPPQTVYWRFPESVWELLWSASHLQISSFSNACWAIYLTCHVCFLCAQFKVLWHFWPPPPFLLVPQLLPWVIMFPPFTRAEIYLPHLGSTSSPFLLQPFNTHPLCSSPLGPRLPTQL